MSNYKIFFSYAREDAQFALRLATDLRMAGADIWMDQLDIRAGTRWDIEVERALQLAQALLVILTPSSVASHNVSDEISYALEEGKRVIPVFLKECVIPFRIRRIQYADFTKIYANGFNELLKTLELTANKQIIVEYPVPVISRNESITSTSTIDTPVVTADQEKAEKNPVKPAPVKSKTKLGTIREKKVLTKFEEVNFSYNRKKDIDKVTGILYVNSHSLEYKSTNHDFIVPRISAIEYMPAADGILWNYMKVDYYKDNVISEIYFSRYTLWGFLDSPTLNMVNQIQVLIAQKKFILFLKE